MYATASWNGLHTTDPSNHPAPTLRSYADQSFRLANDCSSRLGSPCLNTRDFNRYDECKWFKFASGCWAHFQKRYGWRESPYLTEASLAEFWIKTIDLSINNRHQPADGQMGRPEVVEDPDGFFEDTPTRAIRHPQSGGTASRMVGSALQRGLERVGRSEHSLLAS